MRITVMGTGYVGLVVGACLAETGNDVVCVDTDEGKIAGLQNGKIPIFEPGLESMVQRNEEFGRLRFSTDLDGMVAAAEVVVIAVGTPSGESASVVLLRLHFRSPPDPCPKRYSDRRLIQGLMAACLMNE